MAHIPYYGEEDDSDAVVVKSNNRHKRYISYTCAAAMSFITFWGYAADYETQYASYSHQDEIEEVIVTETDLSNVKTERGEIAVALSDTVLVHNYDVKTDTWKFVGVKTSEKSE